jgi:hypothetical protein
MSLCSIPTSEGKAFRCRKISAKFLPLGESVDCDYNLTRICVTKLIIRNGPTGAYWRVLPVSFDLKG